MSACACMDPECAKVGRCLAREPNARALATPLPVYYERPEFRTCEFCGCDTNARMRACCEKGRDADRVTPNAKVSGGGAFPPSA